MTRELARDVEDTPTFEARYGARLGEVATLVREVVPQTEGVGARGFLGIDVETARVVGTCAFRAPAADGSVEIAYFTFPPFEGRGIARAMASALVDEARASGDVQVLRAHTLPETNASTAILERLGFAHLGAVDDPEDGTIWRWELRIAGPLDARIPEPELMDDPGQALAYARADFEEPHSRFIAMLRERFPDLPERGRALDLGCGPGDVSLRFLRAFPGWQLDAVDGAPRMLALAREAARDAGLDARVRFIEAVLPDVDLPARYDLVLSNSILHHLHRPAVLWDSVGRAGLPGAAVFVMDLRRPADVETADALLARYAAGEPDVLRRDFRASLLAAFRPDEVRVQLADAGLGQLDVDVVSDRHLLVCGRLARGPR